MKGSEVRVKRCSIDLQETFLNIRPHPLLVEGRRITKHYLTIYSTLMNWIDRTAQPSEKQAGFAVLAHARRPVVRSTLRRHNDGHGRCRSFGHVLGWPW